MGEELAFARAEEDGWANTVETSSRQTKAIATFILTSLVLTALGIPGSPRIDLLPNIQAAHEGSKRGA
jgi:hypothetical protein